MPLMRKPQRILRVVKKTETQIVNNSTTLVDDDTLQLPLASGVRYAIIGMIIYETNSTADFKATFENDAAFTVSKLFLDADGFGEAKASFGDAQDVPSATNNAISVYASCTTNSAESPPTLILQWAQNTATVVDTKVLAGSWIEAKEI